MSSIHLKQDADTQLIYTYKHLKSEKDQQLLTYCLSILEFIQLIRRVNRIYKKWDYPTRIKPEVFYKAMHLVLHKKTFNTKTLKAYLKEVKKVEAFKQSFSKLFNTESITFNYNAESLLLGMPFKMVTNPTEKIDDLGAIRFNVLYKFYSGKVGVKKTICKLMRYRDKILILKV